MVRFPITRSSIWKQPSITQRDATWYPTLTGAQFDELVRLMRGKPETAACIAARKVLVEGMTQAEAMHETNQLPGLLVSRGTVSRAVKSYSEADDRIRAAYLGE